MQVAKDETASLKRQLRAANEEKRELGTRAEVNEKEKGLADKVTNELLQRIQLYEVEIQELRKSNASLENAVQAA